MNISWINKIFNKNPVKTSVKEFENIYFELKNKNPDKDEHWRLANTWLVKYGNWEVSKQKGPKLTRYIAYTTTFQWSLLDFPDSIRGLALFLAYKERGDKESGDEKETEESARIIKLVQKIMKSSDLLEVYKNKNPFTWNGIQTEGDESIHGLYGFLKTTDFLSKNPEKYEKAVENGEKLDRGENIKSSGCNIKLSEEQLAEIKRAIETNQ